MRLPIIVSSLLLMAGLAGTQSAATAAPAVSSTLPDLSVRVLPKSGSCAPAALCSVAIHILNEGDAPYEGFVSVFLDLHAPAVSAPPHPDGPPCTREDYGKFRCDLAKLALPPGGYAVIEPEFLFTATAYESSNACASLRWTPRTLIMRDRLLADAVKASGHGTDELMRAAGVSGGDQSRSRLLAALVGRWGEGDALATNDSACGVFAIARLGQEIPCPAGEIREDGRCVALAQWCPSNREHQAGPERCGCPATLPAWNGDTGRCEAETAKLACAAAGADPLNACRCPAERPVLNAIKSACIAVGNVAHGAPQRTEVADIDAAIPPKPTTKPEARLEPSVTAQSKARPEPLGPDTIAVEEEPEHRPAIRRARTTSPEPQPRVVVRKNRAPAKAASVEHRRRCRALQVWGPHFGRCVPLPIFLMGRLFSPGESGRCPAGQHVVNGRCR